MSTVRKRFDIVARGESTSPQYARVTATLSDAEIRAELDSEKGRTDAGWRKALLAERRKRKK